MSAAKWNSVTDLSASFQKQGFTKSTENTRHLIVHRWDSWVGFQWPGFCRPVSYSGDGIIQTEQWSEAQIQNERGVTELWASSPCLLILLLFPAFLIWFLQEMLHFDPWGLESVPLRVLIMFLLHPYRLGVQVAARLRADLRGRQRLPPHTLPGVWSYI